MCTRIQVSDTIEVAVRRLAECKDSAVRVAARGILTELVQQVDHSADPFGALGLLMDMDRRGVYGAAVVALRDRCQDLHEMARQMRGEPSAKAGTPEPTKPPSISAEQLVGELATRLEALALEQGDIELLDDADRLNNSNTIRKTKQATDLLATILRKHKLGANYKGVNNLVFTS